MTFFKIKKTILEGHLSNQPTFDVQVTENFTIVQKGHRIFRRTALYMKLINLPNLSPKNQQKNWEVLRIIWWKLPSSPPPPWQFLSAYCRVWSSFIQALTPWKLDSPQKFSQVFRWKISLVVEVNQPIRKIWWTSNWVCENFFPNSSGAKSWQQKKIGSWPPPRKSWETWATKKFAVSEKMTPPKKAATPRPRHQKQAGHRFAPALLRRQFLRPTWWRSTRWRPVRCVTEAWGMDHCGSFRNPGKKIVEVGSLARYLQVFLKTSQVFFSRFLNHQQ